MPEMTVIDALLEQVIDVPVKDVIIGLYDVLVESCDVGLASTMLRPRDGKFITIRNFGRFTEMRTVELAEYLRSDNLLEAAIGMATVNSSLPRPPSDSFVEVNARELLIERGKDKVVGIIGHFPFVDALRMTARKVLVFEKIPREGDLSESDIPSYLPEADVVGLTATSIINHSFEEVMRHIKPTAFVVMLGPSTPLSHVLFDFGIHALAGTLASDVEKLKREVKEAVPFKFLKSVRRVIWFKP